MSVCGVSEVRYAKHETAKIMETVKKLMARQQGHGHRDVDDRDETCISTVTIGSKILPSLNWTRINYKGEHRDNRRLIEHRERDCQCEICYREINKLPPTVPLREKYAVRKLKEDIRENKRAKKKAKMERNELEAMGHSDHRKN
ncbi:hypothetical protein G9A89_021679 [Geosiphon pyriformis]|nr:hypothetical protein G9A89_021679 [Geosiphon pyriformis]